MKKEKLKQADEQLVANYQETNDDEYFEMLYSRYVGKVYQKCLSMTKDSEAAEDFTQDIFIKVFSKMNTFQQRSKFSTWLYSISHHYCLDQLRVGKRLTTETLADDLVDHISDADGGDDVETKLRDMGKLMEGIPIEEVQLLQLKYEQGVSIREIAERYHLTESAVKMRLKRTRDKLYDRYASYHQE
ncbi:RNA polymerase sigma factor [Spirosoma sp. KUDC1026]|uniref:RNA polymerase sigma factor n=1 Tax=Spirosoma sp. KUDC1026 TaxID=2745947 RepID=UPI00159BC271|nr:RNA polymerase sigma factor [Spirosoma sp. KUDC1026]QKZ13804.1 RNA polymerase sigma factor [Spirosoma sp. KUDC1026]